MNDKDLSQQAKEYFAQIRKTDRLIHRLDSTIATLRSSLTSTGSQLKQDKVQTSGPKNMLIFLCAYLSNVAFSLYYNIKVLLQPFDRQKMINSGLKVATFVVGLTLLCVAITTLPIYADQLGWAIPEEYTEIFADLVIVGAVLMVSCKYIAEAFTKFRAILQVKGDTENE